MDGTDMFKIMQQAMELSKAFGNGGESSNNFDRVAGMLRLFNAGQPEQTRQETKAFGDDARAQALESIKTAIPYIDRRYQRYIGIFVKLIEIQMMMELYSKSAETMFKGAGSDWRRVMLESLRPHLDSARVGMIEFMIAVIDLSDAAGRISKPVPGQDLI